MLLQNAELAASTITDVGEAENWASMLQRQFRPWGFDLAPDLTVPEVLEAARERGGVAAAILAATLAAFGPRRGRYEARRLWHELVAGGVVVPGWVDLLGAVTPVRAVRLTDPWGDECLLWIDYCRPDGSVCGMPIWGGTGASPSRSSDPDRSSGRRSTGSPPPPPTIPGSTSLKSTWPMLGR